MTAGMVLFLLLGVFGSAVHYLAAVTIDGDNALARLAGIAYALGILLQYANNNLVNLEVAEAAFLSVFLAALSLLVIRTRQAAQSRIEMTETAAPLRNLRKTFPSPGKNGRRALCWRCW